MMMRQVRCLMILNSGIHVLFYLAMRQFFMESAKIFTIK